MTRPFILCAVLLPLAGCAAAPTDLRFEDGAPAEDCPDSMKPRLSLALAAVPAPLPPGYEITTDEMITRGALARTVSATLDRGGLAEGWRVAWTRITVGPYGGTFKGWTAARAGGAVITVDGTQSARDAAERLTVHSQPGALRITRESSDGTDLSWPVAVDVVVMPGGRPVDATLLRVPTYRAGGGAPLAAGDIRPALLPLRHPPARDGVRADARGELLLTGTGWAARETRFCRFETEAVSLVDLDAVRQPYWDIAILRARANETRWLALRGPALGPIRVLFDSPGGATALVAWLRETRSPILGHYEVGVFDGKAPESFRPLTHQDLERLDMAAMGQLG